MPLLIRWTEKLASLASNLVQPGAHRRTFGPRERINIDDDVRRGAHGDGFHVPRHVGPNPIELIGIYQVTGYLPSETGSRALWGTTGTARGRPTNASAAGACVLPVNATIDVSIFDDDESSQYAMPLTMPWAYEPFFLTALSMDQELATSYNEAYREGELNCEDIWKGWGHSFCTQLLPPV